MRAAAVICECNPFHRGHAHIFEKAHAYADCVIAVMSGNFVQRASAAVFDKYVRAETLVRCGADLVVELPFPWCSASAEYFASAGVSLAHSLGAESLVFGASQENVEMYRRVAAALDAPAAAESVRAAGEECGAAQLREAYIRRTLGDAAADLLHVPNDILAIEYCRALAKTAADMSACPVRRVSADDDPMFVGASELRTRLFTGEDSLAALECHIPAAAFSVFAKAWRDGAYAEPAKLAELQFYTLRMTASAPDTAEGTGGVLDRLIRCAGESVSAEEMFRRAATKKYTHTRFRRAALFYQLAVRTDLLRQWPRFTHLLAANQTGCAWLSQIRRKTELAILTKPSAADALDSGSLAQYEMQCAADRLYTLCRHAVQPAGTYLRRTPYIAR